ncbi:hypothetical protein CYMTET_42096 [Cymbomonas tetramitiformis]|uniref:Uncharacterized protein n=1 Tax=Cymbomonas tetramitiformis TaxID=36881 RepID=A0AAE0F2X3_9CHLO|nr:hypothetical protein CYMTET_42097 [Cymbomonas tetramitiformis]KAK3248440.1 hypothetical protein CYMTET_42096 [Cymbomonas tetramitiformis]
MSRPVDFLKFWFGNEYLTTPDVLDSMDYVQKSATDWIVNEGAPNDESICKNFLEIFEVLSQNELAGEWKSATGLVSIAVVGVYIACRKYHTPVPKAKQIEYRDFGREAAVSILRSGSYKSLPLALQFFICQVLVYDERPEIVEEAMVMVNDIVQGDKAKDRLFEVYLITPAKDKCAVKIQASYRGFQGRKKVAKKKAT